VEVPLGHVVAGQVVIDLFSHPVLRSGMRCEVDQYMAKDNGGCVVSSKSIHKQVAYDLGLGQRHVPGIRARIPLLDFAGPHKRSDKVLVVFHAVRDMISLLSYQIEDVCAENANGDGCFLPRLRRLPSLQTMLAENEYLDDFG